MKLDNKLLKKSQLKPALESTIGTTLFCTCLKWVTWMKPGSSAWSKYHRRRTPNQE